MPFVLIWFGTKPKQMPFGKSPTRPKRMEPNEINAFGTKPKQIWFGNWPSRPNQMGPNEILTFGTKPKQMTFGNWLARLNQIRPNDILPFGFKANLTSLVTNKQKRVSMRVWECQCEYGSKSKWVWVSKCLKIGFLIRRFWATDWILMRND